MESLYQLKNIIDRSINFYFALKCIGNGSCISKLNQIYTAQKKKILPCFTHHRFDGDGDSYFWAQQSHARVKLNSPLEAWKSLTSKASKKWSLSLDAVSSFDFTHDLVDNIILICPQEFAKLIEIFILTLTTCHLLLKTPNYFDYYFIPKGRKSRKHPQGVWTFPICIVLSFIVKK